MTLKDFHGGSIPSDLPLPSAPGIIVRSSDRSSYDRQTAWGNPAGRSDYRTRPGSSPATRNFDDKTPFLSHTGHIGRNFDEDERKPLDGVSAPRRTVSDETLHAPPIRAELKPDSVSAGRLSGRQGLTPVSQLPTAMASSYSARLSESAHVGVNSQNSRGNSAHPVSGAYPNAWAVRKEVVGVTEPVLSAWSESVAVSKLAHASALEKVSSGRWQTKHSVHHQPDVEVIKYPEMDSGSVLKGSNNNNNSNNGMGVVSERENYDAMLDRHAERGPIIEDGVWGGGKELQSYEKARSPMYLETKDGNPAFCTDSIQPAPNHVKFGGHELQSSLTSEASERPKLFARLKPLEVSEPPVINYKQGYQGQSDSAHAEIDNQVHGNLSPEKSGSGGTESGNRALERPKLNLKPRSQPLQQVEDNVEKERSTLFGGARPRELVLKERGIDDVADNHDLSQPPIRVKHDVPKTETVFGHASSRNSERAENLPFDHRIGKNTERKDQRVDIERADMQKRNWRNENWRNSRETEKQQQQQQQQERQRSPETWRKPVEEPKPASPDTPGLRYGKAASAVELAQAFSRSVSDPKTVDGLSSQRGLPSRTQVPFSRLTSPTPRRQINGY
ncbi:hypothetical protein L1049_010624 [Liquidambar formosana]|uniref:Eukaryotic translation initiation factor-related n=1 Tax=Liquidambar formosana TaxID=63359 RepID=A0AAP0R275_LIQFO